MLVFALALVVVYAVFTGLVGTRLLVLASRTRALPEATLGLSYIVGGMLGWAAVLFGGGIIHRAPTLGFWLNAIGLFCFSGGTLGIGLFCWRVFSPTSPWARGVFFVLLAVLVVDFVHNIGFLGVPFPPANTFWFWPGMLARSAVYAWRPLVALPSYFRLRRRLAIGLADPVATNRVLLWGLAGAVTFVAAVLVSAASVANLWDTPAQAPMAIAAVLASAFDATLSWLAFVPPRRYVAWVEARALRAEA